MADQFCADALGCVGGYIRTPNLDRLAARGVRFDSAYTNSAECVPSRLSLATGLYPRQTRSVLKPARRSGTTARNFQVQGLDRHVKVAS